MQFPSERLGSVLSGVRHLHFILRSTGGFLGLFSGPACRKHEYVVISKKMQYLLGLLVVT
ncbi:hypothetical protein HK44_020195 [Pseudomonas fluorescens HK44]|uniref:Uncharacterized protein n=1 Tax=Pseudomonas fluorescens HK44 TaxID=1042209 RepID=A0A010TH53_PSEFL|nr:hypothetical protein HK44_020195 [Pseudomonas fluorescens HK44]